MVSAQNSFLKFSALPKHVKAYLQKYHSYNIKLNV